MGEGEGTGDSTLDPAVEAAQEQTYLAYVQRWAVNGRRTKPLRRDQVIQMFLDFPLQDQAGRISLNHLLEFYPDE